MDKDNSQKKYSALSHIGERIRDIRQRKGITQAELVGDNVTRNMLSRIENGAALPSLPTLCAIAERLDIPVGALLGDLEDYVNRKLSDEIRGLLSQKKYTRAITAYNNSDQKIPNDDLATMMAKAHLGVAKECYLQGKLNMSLEHLEEAEDFCDICPEKASETLDGIFLLRTVIFDSTALPEEGQTTILSESEARLRSIVFDNNSLSIYLYCKAKLGNISSRPYSQPHEDAHRLRAEIMPLIGGISDNIYRLHIDAKLHMAEADYLEAKSKLMPLVALDNVPPSLMYELYTDLELCCKCCGDFENAYKYSGFRLEIIKRIN